MDDVKNDVKNKTTKEKGFRAKILGSLEISMVPKAGLEPARRELRLILSQVRLPIPPLRHMMQQQKK